MFLPVIAGVIRRRILANYRVDAAVAGRLLPAGLKPKLVHGRAIAGVCLIRLEDVRPQACLIGHGFSSENAATRIAVVDGKGADAVYIWRRDTNSRLNSFAGGRLFPGYYHHAKFEVQDDGQSVGLRYAADDGGASLQITGGEADDMPAGSIFPDLATASSFFLNGCLGYSPRRRGAKVDAMELRCDTWPLRPMAVHAISSSYFGDEAKFPRGSIEFDSAYIMRNVQHTWHRREGLAAAGA